MVKANEINLGTKFFRHYNKKPVEETIVDLLTTTNSKGEIVRQMFVTTHEYMGQLVYNHDVPVATVQRSLLKQEQQKEEEVKRTKKEKKITIPAKPRRDWLKRQIIKGNMLCMCDYSYTDDYAFDAANGFGKSDKWEECRVGDEFVEGIVNFTNWHFKTKSGGCYRKDDIIVLNVHSNCSYSFKLKEGK